MSTRARIALSNGDGTFTSIYTHMDSYISHHGPILLEAYNTKERVQALLALGDLSSLGPQLGSKHPFYEYRTEFCRAYGRDGGYRGVGAAHHRGLDDLTLCASASDAEYLYIFYPDEGWAEWLSEGKPTPLADLVAALNPQEN